MVDKLLNTGQIPPISPAGSSPTASTFDFDGLKAALIVDGWAGEVPNSILNNLRSLCNVSGSKPPRINDAEVRRKLGGKNISSTKATVAFLRRIQSSRKRESDREASQRGEELLHQFSESGSLTLIDEGGVPCSNENGIALPVMGLDTSSIFALGQAASGRSLDETVNLLKLSTIGTQTSLLQFQVERDPYIMLKYNGSEGIKRNKSKEFPAELTKQVRVIEENGHMFEEIVDHLLFTSTHNPMSSMKNITTLFPPCKDEAEYRNALEQTLKICQESQSVSIIAFVADSASFWTEVIYKGAKSLREEDTHFPDNNLQEAILDIGSGVFLGNLMPKLNKKKEFYAVEIDRWAAKVIEGLAGRFGLTRLKVLNYDFVKLDESLIPEKLSLVRAAGVIHYDDTNIIGKLRLILPRIVNNGQLVVQVPASLYNRCLAIDGKSPYTDLANYLTSNGWAFDFQLGTTGPNQPIHSITYDTFTFTKKSQEASQEGCRQWSDYIKIVTPTFAFEDPDLTALERLAESFGGSAEEVMDSIEATDRRTGQLKLAYKNCCLALRERRPEDFAMAYHDFGKLLQDT